MRHALKFGGLLFSGALTVSLFIRLFGTGAYGVTMALAGLALFEFGAVAWASILPNAKHGQRAIAALGLWFCIGASIASSSAEIIMATRLWMPGFDLPFVTLLIICASLALNVAGAVAFEQLDPALAARNRELDRQARAQKEAARLEEQVIDQALIKSESRVAEMAGDVSDHLSRELAGDVVNYLLAQTRGGDTRSTSGASASNRARRAALPGAYRYSVVSGANGNADAPGGAMAARMDADDAGRDVPSERLYRAPEFAEAERMTAPAPRRKPAPSINSGQALSKAEGAIRNGNTPDPKG